MSACSDRSKGGDRTLRDDSAPDAARPTGGARPDSFGRFFHGLSAFVNTPGRPRGDAPNDTLGVGVRTPRTHLRMRCVKSCATDRHEGTPFHGSPQEW